MRMLLFIFALALIFQTPLFAVCPDEDLSGDCKVNSVDLRIFANDWLAEGQVFIESAGLVVMEAEHYTAKKAASGPLISCQWYEVSGDGSVGDGYMQTLPDDQKSADGSEILAYSPSLSYSINFTTSGLYYLWVKGFALDGTDDSFHYGLDGQPFSSDRYNCGSILQSAQGIFDWRSKKGDETRLTVMIQSPGVHTLDIWMREDGARIDRLLLTTQEGYSPSSPSESSGFSKSSADIYEDGLVNFLDFVFFAAQWLNESGPVIISEFMADNETTLADQDGLYSDWIEIVNLSDFTVNMADWYLTDDPEELDKWTFPDIEIPPAGYLIIFASGNHDEEHPLHTNFKLDNDGEYLALVMPDGSIAHQYNEYYRHDTDEFGFPPQSDDISYGIAFGSDLKVFFSTPTPNEINVEGEGVKIEPPQFSKPDAFFTDSFNLQLETSSELATIYYTLDGSEPDIGCPVYSSSIPISSTTVVRAKAFEPGYSWWSDGITKRYVKLDSDIQNFNSNLPIVVIDTFGQSPSKTEQILILATIIDTNEAGRASITEEPDFTGTVGFRIRGSSSASSSVPKYQYTFEICDQNFQDVDATFLDFPEESDFILQGPYTDKSLMRNVLTYQWGQDMGNYGGVRTRYVEAFMNTNGDDSIRMGDFATVSPTLPYNYNGDYIGAYILMEKIKRDKNRVNITKISSLDNVEPEVTGGYIIKHDRMDPEDTGFFTSRGNPYDPNPLLALCYVEPKEIEITPQQSAWLIGYLDAFEDAIYGPDPYNPDTGYPKYIDVPTLIDQYILFQITKEPDALRLSTFYYKDRGGKLKAGPAWDFNIALGNCNYGGDYTGWKFYGAWPYLFLADIEFQISFADRWFELREHVISTSKIMSDIDGYALLLNEAQIRNFQRWPYLLGYYVWPNVDGYAQRDTYQKEVDYLKNWLQLRMPHFDGLVANDFAQYPPDIFVNGTKENIGKQITTSDSISMTANSSGTIYYTTDGSDPRVKAEGSSTVLVEETAAKKVLVPASNINDNWKGGGSFDDSYWTHGL
ncbi:MAG: CotH kinase family protein, partial [Sedimentisphaerales bacterium]|nr:CotH kinase family protein [Sedimentisphaerales bacterium]